MLIAPEKEAQQRALCKLLYRELREYYSYPQHRKQFEEWYLKQYGVPYVWKMLSDLREGNCVATEI